MEFDWAVIAANLGFLGEGMLVSLLLVVSASLGGLLLGGALAWMRSHRWRALAGFAAVYVALMRSIPLVLMLFWFYFLVPLVIGRPIGALASAIVAFVLFEGAFYCEIVRAGIAAVPRGQRLAGRASGLTDAQVMRLIVLPQALRAMVPLFLNQVIIVFQDTSLVYVVALRDFMTAASVVASRDGRPIEMYVTVAVTYFILCFAGSTLVARRRSAVVR
jgi:glutamate/aspartate transport system permease protein